MSLARFAALALVMALAAPAWSQTAPPPPTQQAGDAFGEAVTLTPHPMVVKKGSGTWDSAFDSITEALKAVRAQLDKQGLKPTGPAMTIFTNSDDTGFDFDAGYPVATAPAAAPDGFAVRQSPEGKTLKFVHRGTYESMTTTDEAITNHLDEKQLDQRDLVIEEYVADPATTPDDQLIVNLYVPIK